MGKDQFDKFIYDQFANQEIPIDTNEIWSNVESKLDRRSNGGYFGLLGSLAVLILGIAGLIWLLSNSASTESDSNVQATAVVELEDNKLSGANNEGNSKGAYTVHPGVDEKNFNNSGTKERESGDNKDLHNSLNNLKTNPIGSSLNLKKANPSEDSYTLSNTTNKNIGSSKSIKRRDSNSHLLKNSGEKLDQKTIDRIINGSPDLVREGDIEVGWSTKSKNDYTGSKKNSMQRAINNGGSVEKTNAISADRAVRNYFSIVGISSMRPASKLLFSEEAKDHFDGMCLPGIDLNDCYSFSENSVRYVLDAYIALDAPFKSLKENTDQLDFDYVDARKNSEKYLEAFSAGLAFNVIHRTGLFVSTGINYSQIDEKFSHIHTEVETIFDSIIVRIEIDSAGGMDTVKKYGPITSETINESTIYNYYRLVDIPLSIGYQFHKNNWTFEVQMGAMFNLLFNKKGKILHNTQNVIDISDNSVETIFKKNYGISLFGGIKILYPVTNRIGIFAEPYGRISLKPITIDGYSLSQKYNTVGLRLGARWNF